MACVSAAGKRAFQMAFHASAGSVSPGHFSNTAVVAAWERSKVKTVVKVTRLSSLVFRIEALDCCLHAGKCLGGVYGMSLLGSDCQL